MREFRGDYVHFLYEDGITYMTILTEKIDLDIAKEIVKQRFDFTQGEDACMFVDNTKVKMINKAAREYFGSDESNRELLAIAIYANSFLSVFLANFVIKVNLMNYTVPIKLFTNKENAIKWIQEFKKNNQLVNERTDV